MGEQSIDKMYKIIHSTCKGQFQKFERPRKLNQDQEVFFPCRGTTKLYLYKMEFKLIELATVALFTITNQLFYPVLEQ